MEKVMFKEALLEDFAELSCMAVQFERMIKNSPKVDDLSIEMQKAYIERKNKLIQMQKDFELLLKDLADIVFEIP
ncbi:hypothetical protein [uncultured Lactococcus sp.]|uniref:hypothetical protein n=1 Tax=uncultured Lactococcus sp. TaxID=167973 RepID=UPI0027DE1CE0|nr:hypothetical protein [uncultured Lactococcus sp.]